MKDLWTDYINCIKDNYIVKKIRYFFDKYKWNRKELEIQKEIEARKNGQEDSEFLPLKNLKDEYKNKRCFIVATGPSLTLEDLNLIQDEISFSCNSICKIYENTTWRPTFYGIQDVYVYKKMEPIIEKYYKDSTNIFVSDELAHQYSLPKNYVKYPYDTVYHEYDMHFNKFYSKFSNDAYSIVYDGYSITYSLLQIAVYMGFSEIYLLGADCSYKKGEKNHFVESGHHDRLEYLNHDKMVTGYNAAKEYADTHDIKIINCTRGGMLEVFPRMKLEDVIRRKNNVDK
ncbi:MAG: 6-hydroxymethylpterin diphosphokinase MptE-like protein [Oscillospiraceae bacterium]